MPEGLLLTGGFEMEWTVRKTNFVDLAKVLNELTKDNWEVVSLMPLDRRDMNDVVVVAKQKNIRSKKNGI